MAASLDSGLVKRDRDVGVDRDRRQVGRQHDAGRPRRRLTGASWLYEYSVVGSVVPSLSAGTCMGTGKLDASGLVASPPLSGGVASGLSNGCEWLHVLLIWNETSGRNHGVSMWIVRGERDVPGRLEVGQVDVDLHADGEDVEHRHLEPDLGRGMDAVGVGAGLPGAPDEAEAAVDLELADAPVVAAGERRDGTEALGPAVDDLDADRDADLELEPVGRQRDAQPAALVGELADRERTGVVAEVERAGELGQLGDPGRHGAAADELVEAEVDPDHHPPRGGGRVVVDGQEADGVGVFQQVDSRRRRARRCRSRCGSRGRRCRCGTADRSR